MSDVKQALAKPKQEKNVHDTYKIALAIQNGEAKGQYLYCMQNDNFYNYNKGYWEGLNKVEFLGRLEEKLPGLIKYSPQVKKQIVESFKTRGRINLTDFNWAELLNLENGMISPYTGDKEDHNPNFKSTIRIPYVFNPEAKCELWLKSLNEIMENNQAKINILQEYFGYCLTRETKHEKALLLLGESRSGKSTILDTLNNIIGEENCSAVPLKYLSNPQYTAMLINKLVNIDYDVYGKAEDYEAEFRVIVTGEKLQVNQKFIAAFVFYPYCKMAMAANTFPRITDHTSAFYNRLILIPCDRVFTPEEQNKDLWDQLLKESPGILNWAIEGLKRLTKRGKFEELDFMKEAIQDLEDENNPSNLFFDEHIQIDMSDGIYIEKGELFEKYQQWCKETNNYTLNKSRFATVVFRKYHKVTTKSAQHEATRKRIWRHIKYIINKDASKPDAGWQND